MAVLEYVLENGYYDNAGEQVTTIKKEDTIKKFTCPEFKSKYIISFDEYKQESPVDKRIEKYMHEGYEKYTELLNLQLVHAI